jgi:hypothetical protein
LTSLCEISPSRTEALSEALLADITLLEESPIGFIPLAGESSLRELLPFKIHLPGSLSRQGGSPAWVNLRLEFTFSGIASRQMITQVRDLSLLGVPIPSRDSFLSVIRALREIHPHGRVL